MNISLLAFQKRHVFKSSVLFLLFLFVTDASADAPNITLERHDEMIEWPAGAPWNGEHLNSEYKDAQIAIGATGAMLLYLPVTRPDLDEDGETDSDQHQTLFRWNNATDRFESIVDDLNINTGVARDTYDADFADINGDGAPDIVHSSPHGNFIFVNDGSDHFDDETLTRLPSFLRADCKNIWDDVVSGDVDGDGDIDLVFSNRSHNIGPAGCTDRRFWGPNAIIYNDGDGVFGRTQILGRPTDVPAEDREGASHGIEIVDINNDGRLDLVISRSSNYTGGGASLTALKLEYRLNSGDTDGDGRINWASAVNIQTNGNIYNIETFDFDNDGDMDIYAAHNGDDQVHLNQFADTGGTTLFNSVAENTLTVPNTSNYSYDISVADLNNDGLLDMAVGDVDGNRGVTGLGNALLLNDGGTGFELSNNSLINNPAAFFRLSVAFADVNLDNKIDMVWGSDERFDDNETPTVILNTTAGVTDTRAPKIENPTLLFSAGFPAAANFRVRLTDSSPDLDDISATLNWTATGSMGTVIVAPAPIDLTWAAKSTYQARLPCSLFSSFQPGETLASFSGSVTAADGRTTPNSTTVNLTSFGAGVPADLASEFIASVGSEVGITILEPTATSPSVAQPNDGSGRLLVRVKLSSIDLQPEHENFRVTIGGFAAPVITGSLVANEMWLVVQTPATNLTSDLQVTYVPCGITTSTSTNNAVVFTGSPIDTDTVIVIDRSGSMEDNRKMDSAKNAGSLWVNTLRDNERVGAAWYAGVASGSTLGHAEVNFDIDEAGNGTNRVDAIEEIEDLIPDGGTPLGTGLVAGLNELNSVPSAIRNDIRQIVLLSDGLENVPHFWSEPPDGWPPLAVPNVPAIDSFTAPAGEDVIIHTISLGPEADHALMANIAALRGGNHVVADLDPGAADVGGHFSLINEAYAAINLSTSKLPNRLADIYEAIHNASTPQQRHWKGEFVVTRDSHQDPIVGIAAVRNPRLDILSFPMEPGLSFATISVNWDGAFEDSVVLVPDGAQPAATIQESRSSSNTVFRITDPVAGNWRIGLPKKWVGTEVLVTVSGVSQTTGILRQAVPDASLDVGNRAVRARTILPSGSPVTMVLALVDTDPISGATVIGEARDINGKIETFNFVDNGVAPDENADDGIYTGVFTDTDEGGAYNIEAIATWVGTDSVSRQRIFTTAVTLQERDRDNDGISDIREDIAGLNPDDPGDAGQDADGDGLDNWKDVNFGLNPFAADTDAGGLGDQQEICLGLDPQNPNDDDKAVDSDADGMPDIWELHFSLNINDASDATQDLDGDGLSNLQEYKYCTGPGVKDTDDDGITDGEEVDGGLDPNDPKNRADIPVDPGGKPLPCPVCDEEASHLLWECWLLLALVIILCLVLFFKRRH